MPGRRAWLKFAWNELAIMRGLTPSLPGLDQYRLGLEAVTRESNGVLFEVVEELVRTCRDGEPTTISRPELAAQSRRFVDRLVRQRDAFVLANQDELLAALEPALSHTAVAV